MIHSHSSEDLKFNLFSYFLTELISGNEKYRKSVNQVLLDTKNLVQGNTDIFSIDRDNYPIIMFLSNSKKAYFDDLNTNRLDIGVYKDVYKMLKKQSTLVF